MATIYRGARILTAIDDSAPVADPQALVVEGDVISFVGDPEAALEAAGDDAQVVDLDGGLIVPGFFDAHCHLQMMGEALSAVPLTDARSIEVIQDRLRAGRAADPSAPRLFGRGWLFDSVPNGDPTAAMIDAAVPDVPVYLNANDYHSCWVNSAALAELGVTRDTTDPAGGRIGKDADGEPNGMFYETAMHLHIWPLLAEVQTDEERDDALELALHTYLEAGVTGVVDMSLNQEQVDSLDRIAMRRGGELPLTVVAHWWIDNAGDEAANLAEVERALALNQREGRPWLRVAGIKLMLDGVIDACTAAMRRPYTDGSNADTIWSRNDLYPVVAAADAAGLQIALHAIGDAASDLALDALEHASEVNGQRDRRHRIEHLEYAAPGTPSRMAKLGVTASMQPVHADPSIWENWAAMIGAERADRGFAWPEYVEAGALLAFSTDAPTAPYEALSNMFVAATRRSALEPERAPIQPWMALPLAAAIAHGTRDAAASCREEDRRGTLAPGMKADFAVLERDPFVEGVEVLRGGRVARTVVGGVTRHIA